MVVGWILVTHDGNGGLRSCDHRHGVGVKKGVKRASEADCHFNPFPFLSECAQTGCDPTSENASKASTSVPMDTG